MPKQSIIGVVVLVALAGGIAASSPWWWERVFPAPAPAKKDDAHHAAEEAQRVKISPQARKNLSLKTGKVHPVEKPFWARVEVPGWVVERPGSCERVVSAPVEGVIETLVAIRGDLVKPAETLFRIQILSEVVNANQTNLYKTLQELDLAIQEKALLDPLRKNGTLPPVRLMELESQIKIRRAAIDTLRQQLRQAGLTEKDLTLVEAGKLVTHVTLSTPPFPPHAHELPPDYTHDHVYEVEELKVLLGESVKPGQALCVLADHQMLWIEGKVFASELSLVQRAANEGWTVDMSMATDGSKEDALVAKLWPALPADLKIVSVSNRVDEDHQTLSFFVPLPNPYKEYVRAGKSYRLWRFRPGQRLGLKLPTKTFDDVFVLPAGAVVRQGPETFVFRENGDFFERIAVVVVHESPDVILVENDGSIFPGTTIALNNASSINFARRVQQSGDGGGHHHDHDH